MNIGTWSHWGSKQLNMGVKIIIGIVIVDDEKKICRLIEYLIDWEALGVELLGVAYNGIAALQLIQEKNPDILITDICMPGMDGLALIEAAKKQNPLLKCIIISGFKDFAYAQQGMRYGVKDYLLKPINKEELLHDLNKITQETLELKNNHVEQVEMKATIRNYSDELRRIYLKMAIEEPCEMGLQEYLLGMQKKKVTEIKERARFILVKPDFELEQYTRNGYDLLIEKTKEIIKTEFSVSDENIIMETAKEGICVLLFNDAFDRNEVLKIANRIREKVIGLRDLFPGINVSIILGKSSEQSDELSHGIYLARITMYNRILTGPNHITELNRAMWEVKKHDTLNEEIQRVLEHEMETFELNTIIQCFHHMKQILTAEDSIHGIEIKLGLTMFAQYFLNQCQKLDETFDFKECYECFEQIIEHSTTLEDVWQRSLNEIARTYNQVLSDIKNRDIRPILYAKQYIDENKGKNIKLEDLSKTVGFSYAYFSSLFKKETGQTLTDYIQNTRIKEAKQLLVGKDMSISEVAIQVGYNDVKFFTKQFKKTVGISPNEYHKMFVER